jgi:hypothetical protein
MADGKQERKQPALFFAKKEEALEAVQEVKRHGFHFVCVKFFKDNCE